MRCLRRRREGALALASMPPTGATCWQSGGGAAGDEMAGYLR